MNSFNACLNDMIGGRFDYSYVSCRHDMSKYKYSTVALSDLLIMRPKYRYELQDNDILVARTGNTAGRTYIHKSQDADYNCASSDNMICLTVVDFKILPDYLFAFMHLSCYNKWLETVKGSATAPKISVDDLEKLQVILPPLNIQKELADKFRNALKAKLSKDNEARSLTDGIDGYVYDTLGIKQSNSVEQKSMFTITLSDIIGKRMDVSSHKEHIVMTSGKNTEAELSSLMKIVNNLKSGNDRSSTRYSGMYKYIVDEVRNRLQKACQLREAGTDLLNITKQEIESILMV